jgi:hypothetical protein
MVAKKASIAFRDWFWRNEIYVAAGGRKIKVARQPPEKVAGPNVQETWWWTCS